MASTLEDRGVTTGRYLSCIKMTDLGKWWNCRICRDPCVHEGHHILPESRQFEKKRRFISGIGILLILEIPHMKGAQNNQIMTTNETKPTRRYRIDTFTILRLSTYRWRSFMPMTMQTKHHTFANAASRTLLLHEIWWIQDEDPPSTWPQFSTTKTISMQTDVITTWIDLNYGEMPSNTSNKRLNITANLSTLGPKLSKRDSLNVQDVQTTD